MYISVDVYYFEEALDVIIHSPVNNVQICDNCESMKCESNLTDFINENYTRLDFYSQGKNSCGELLRFTIPLVCQRGSLQVDELAP